MVAVKVIQDGLTDEDTRRSFTRGVEILAGIAHPALLGFRGWVPPNGSNRPAVLTELMPRGSLQSLIDAEVKHAAPADWTATRKFIALYGTAVGMLVLHHNRVMHRDLKPDNVLLSDDFEPKVGGFTLSKVVDPGAAMQHSGDVGTPVFMAPELIEGDEYSFTVDVYAFAMLCYHAVTLLPPFPRASTLNVFQAVCRGERPPIPSSVGENWRALVTECWEASPERRPTFEEIVMRMGGVEFLDDSIDKREVLAYQRRTLPAKFYLKL
jgi:serine/threonine protein kinase